MVEYDAEHLPYNYHMLETEALGLGLLRTAVEMGEAVTEKGAISAAAAFFRQELDACAWIESLISDSSERVSLYVTRSCVHNLSDSDLLSNHSVEAEQHQSEANQGLEAPTRLRFEVRLASMPHASARLSEHDGVAPSSPTRFPLDQSREPAQLELVVSRAAGPAFSSLESALTTQAAALLGQTLSRLRVLGAFKDTEKALQGAFRGMKEASCAVSALVGEKEQQERVHAEQLEVLRGEGMIAAAVFTEELARSRAKAAEQVDIQENAIMHQRAIHESGMRAAREARQADHRQTQREAAAELRRRVTKLDAHMNRECEFRVAQAAAETKQALQGAQSGTEKALHEAEECGREAERARIETDELRRRVVEVEESVAAIVKGTRRLWRAAAGVDREDTEGAPARECMERIDVRTGNVDQSDLAGMIVDTARLALGCSDAQLKRTDIGVAASPAAVNDLHEDNAEETMETGTPPSASRRAEEMKTDDRFSLELRLLHEPQIHGGSATQQLTLSLRSGRPGGFTTVDRSLAVGLADCLDTALFISRQNERASQPAHLQECGVRTEPNQVSGIVDDAAPVTIDGCRTIAERGHAIKRCSRDPGMIVPAPASMLTGALREDDAVGRGKISSATAGAERNLKALLHLLAALHAATRSSEGKIAEDTHVAAVAKAVASRAANAIPRCVDASLLLMAPRGDRNGDDKTKRGRCDRGRRGPNTVMDSCTNFAANRARSGKPRQTMDSGEVQRAIQRWAADVERAASRARSTGKLVCIRDADFGAVSGNSTLPGVVCFSPVPPASSSSRAAFDGYRGKEECTRKYLPTSNCDDSLRQSCAHQKRGGGVDGTDGRSNANSWRNGHRMEAVLAFTLRLDAFPSLADDDDVFISDLPCAVGSEATNVSSSSTRGINKVSRAIVGVTQAVGHALAAAAVAHRHRCASSRRDDALSPRSSPLHARQPTPSAIMNERRSNTVESIERTDQPPESYALTKESSHGRRHSSSSDGTNGHPQKPSLASEPRSTRDGVVGGDRLQTAVRREEISALAQLAQRAQTAEKNKRPELMLEKQLAVRVQRLERKAGGLRASEARASMALASAKADAMAARGELQLAALERDRLLERLNEKQGDGSKRLQGQKSQQIGWIGGGPSVGCSRILQGSDLGIELGFGHEGSGMGSERAGLVQGTMRSSGASRGQYGIFRGKEESGASSFGLKLGQNTGGYSKLTASSVSQARGIVTDSSRIEREGAIIASDGARTKSSGGWLFNQDGPSSIEHVLSGSEGLKLEEMQGQAASVSFASFRSRAGFASIDGGGDVSNALQSMASVHARLSASLRKGCLGSAD